MFTYGKSLAITPFDGDAFLTSQIKDMPGFCKALKKGKSLGFGARKAFSFIASGEAVSLSEMSRFATAFVISSKIIGHLDFLAVLDEGIKSSRRFTVVNELAC